jgi:LysM repeat protein
VESLKPLLLLLVLGGVAYAVYVALNHAPPPEFATIGPEWNKPPATDPANQNSNGAAPSNAAPGTAGPWQAGAPGSATPGFGTADSASGNTGSAATTPATPAGNGPSGLPFGMSSNAAGSPVATAPPASQMSPSATTMPAESSTNFNAAPAGNFSTPPTSVMNAPAPSSPVSTTVAPNSMMPSAPPNSAMPTSTSPNVDAASAGPTGFAAQNNPAAAAQTRHDYEASTRSAMTLLNQGQLVEALRELSKWYGNAIVPPNEEQRFVDVLSQLAGTVIYSRDPWLGPPYQVRAGDSLESIAQQYQVPWQLLAKINGIQNSNGLVPGEKLKIVHGPFQAQLNVQQGWLALFVDGLYAGRFRVQTIGPLVKPDGAYPVAKFSTEQAGAGSQAPYISLGGDLHLRVPDDALPPGVTAVRISRQDMSDVFDMLSERSQVTIVR